MNRSIINRLYIFSIYIILTSIPCSLNAQHPESDFKVIGYYSMSSAMDGKQKIPFRRLTHINLSFLNPDTLGNFSRDYSPLRKFVNEAHKKNVKVLVSIAGGGEHPYYHNLLREENRALFIQNLVSQVIMYNLDGIDVDIEGNDIDENYEAFVSELRQTLKQHQKMITAAVAVYYKDQMSDKALAQFDFVNIMVYDRTGPWRPEKPGQHSSFANAVEDLDYFGSVRNIPKEKMVLGVPFYGYGFGPDVTSPVKAMNYNQIVSAFHGAESADQWIMNDGMIMYYNGIPTIKQKTELAKEKASGIMIWHVRGDARGSKSLLKVINKARRGR
jgi:chitinase